MTTFVATIVIDVEDGEDAREQALTVLAERLSHDEDYGFPYTVRHEHNLTERDDTYGGRPEPVLPGDQPDEGPCADCEHIDCSLERDVRDGLRPSVGAPLYDEAGEGTR